MSTTSNEQLVMAVTLEEALAVEAVLSGTYCYFMLDFMHRFSECFDDLWTESGEPEPPNYDGEGLHLGDDVVE